MKKAFILLALAFVFTANAQDDKTVTLTVTSQGKTVDEAKTNALRSAIEQAFGAFISSNTTILNDNIIKDEIVAVTNGNIQKFDIINETTLPDGTYAETLKATVSVSKLTIYCESKGVKVEFQGGLFAMNIAIQELNEKSERIAWSNLYSIIEKMIPKCFEYKIKVDEPFISEEYKPFYEVPIDVNIDLNDNYTSIIDLLYNFTKSICLNDAEIETFRKIGKEVYPKQFNKGDNKIFYIRTRSVCDSISYIPFLLFLKSYNAFVIQNGIEDITVDSYLQKKLKDDEFHVRIDCNFGKNSNFYGDLNSYFEWFDGHRDLLVFENDRKYDLFRGSNNRLVFDKSTKQVSLVKEGRLFDLDDPFFHSFHTVNYANFYGHKEFFKLKFIDYRTIDEIKKIKEYRIIPNK